MTTAACKAWNVISGGPSRKFIAQADLISDSPVVTVNRAIDVIDQGITVDFAAFADPPSRIFELMHLDRYLQPPIQVWCPRPAVYLHNNVPNIHDEVSMWEPFLPASVGIRTMPFGTIPAEDGSSRFMFCFLAALERVMMFRPKMIRIFGADMMGSWIHGKTEEECEALQSDLEHARKELGSLQQQLNATRGRNPDIVIARDTVMQKINELQRGGDPGIFKRWRHERSALRAFQAKAGAHGCQFEYVTPKGAVLS
jgi:hypothetical protein